jgi:hypothetical protein
VPTVLLTAGCLDKQQHHDAATLIQADGFTRAENFDEPIETKFSSITIGSLVLGKCIFKEVGADVVSDGRTITDVTHYSVDLGDITTGKYHNSNLTLTFDNAAELEQELPGINCFPG